MTSLIAQMPGDDFIAYSVFTPFLVPKKYTRAPRRDTNYTLLFTIELFDRAALFNVSKKTCVDEICRRRTF